MSVSSAIRMFVPVLLAVLAVACNGVTDPPGTERAPYDLVVIDLPGAPVALNDAGQIAGTQTLDGEPHAWLWQEGEAIVLGPGTATDMNASGIVVGTRDSTAVMWQDGQAIELYRPSSELGFEFGSTVAAARAINDQGVVAGDVRSNFYCSSGGVCSGYGFFVQDGQVEHFLEWEPNVRVTAINNDGWIVGAVGSANHCEQQPFLLREREPEMLVDPAPDCSVSSSYRYRVAQDIDDRGVIALNVPAAHRWQNGALAPFGDQDIVVEALNVDGLAVGRWRSGTPVLWTGSAWHAYEDLIDAAGWEIVEAIAINDQGHLLASALDQKNGRQYWVMLRLREGVTLP